MLQNLLYFGGSLLAALALTPLVRRLAFRVGAVDQPNERKVHARIMPRLGGLAIYLAFLVVVLATQSISQSLRGLLLGGTVVVILGVLDDIIEISPKIKLLGQLVAGGILIYHGVEVNQIANPFQVGGEIPPFPWYLSIPVTLFWVVGVTNAVNLVDGLDGLAGGVAAIAAGTIGIVVLTDVYGFNDYLGTIAFILAGATLGFLRYNFNPARIFMGDSGSLFLGFTLSAFGLMGVAKSATIISLFVPILILGIPIFDTLSAIVRRMINGQPIFQADKEHLHHRLLASGLSHKQTVLAIYAINLVLSASAVLLTKLNTSQSLIILVALAVLALIGADKLGFFSRKTEVEVEVRDATRDTTISG